METGGNGAERYGIEWGWPSALCGLGAGQTGLSGVRAALKGPCGGEDTRHESLRLPGSPGSQLLEYNPAFEGAASPSPFPGPTYAVSARLSHTLTD